MDSEPEHVDGKAEFEESLAESVVSDLESKEPDAEEKKALKAEHDGHLVRYTTSKLSMDPNVADGVEAQATAEVPDMYCFTCEEWVGLSGVDLRGTPRSRRDAFYLGGMPPSVLAAQNGTVETLNELADALIERVDHLDTRADAYEFIQTELEKVME